MPYVTEWRDPELFLEHNGVKVFHIYRDDDMDAGAHPHYYTTNESGGSYEDLHGANGTFDVNLLDVPAAAGLHARPPFLNRENFPNGPDSPEYREALQQWVKWHAEGEPAAIRAVVIEAIDRGLVKAWDDSKDATPAGPPQSSDESSLRERK